MPRHDDGYISQKDKNAKGIYDLVVPLDYLLLEKLQDEGTLFAGLYPLGDTVIGLGKKFDQVKGGLDPKIVTSRLRSMQIQGLTISIHSGTSSGTVKVWQRTPVGATVLETWKKGQSSGDS